MTIFCIGRNYTEHAKELNNPVPAEPVLFLKPATALLLNNRPFYYPNFTKDLHYECELVFQIHKKGKSIPESQALDYVSQVTVGIDFTARDLQQQCKSKGLPWEIAKAFDKSAVVGKWLPVEGFDLNAIPFRLKRNQQTVQEGNSGDMIFNLPRIIAHISGYFTLNKGDLIYTGTPAGVGPVAIGDQLQGFIGDQELFHFEIK